MSKIINTNIILHLSGTIWVQIGSCSNGSSGTTVVFESYSMKSIQNNMHIYQRKQTATALQKPQHHFLLSDTNTETLSIG